jgi:ribosomal protein S7
MVGMRSDRARARARNLLATIYPVPQDVEFHRLRELALDYIQEAERMEAENKGRSAESGELISAALDAVARDYFSRALDRAASRRRR